MSKTFSEGEIQCYYSADDVGSKFDLLDSRKAGWLRVRREHFVDVGATIFSSSHITGTQWDHDGAFVVFLDNGCRLYFLGRVVGPFEAYKDNPNGPANEAKYKEALQKRNEIWAFVAEQGKPKPKPKKKEEKEPSGEKTSLWKYPFKALWWVIKQFFKLFGYIFLLILGSEANNSNE